MTILIIIGCTGLVILACLFSYSLGRVSQCKKDQTELDNLVKNLFEAVGVTTKKEGK
jgi:hypothetical protein